MKTNITKLCKIYKKKPSHFLDNADFKKHSEIKTGKDGYTKIDDSILKEFLLWLSPETRKMVLDGDTTDNILSFLSSK